MTDIFLILYKIFSGFLIVCGLWTIGKYINMCRYQWKYGGNAGIAYLKGRLQEYIKTGELKDV